MYSSYRDVRLIKTQIKGVPFKRDVRLYRGVRLSLGARDFSSAVSGLWVFFIFAFHYIPVLICDLVWLLGRDREGGTHLKSLVYVFLFHWLRDDTSLRILGASAQNRNKDVRRMLLLSNVLFVIENISMILLFYFSPFSYTWYSLPVTIYVYLVTILGAVMRLTHFYSLRRNQMVDQIIPIKCILYRIVEITAL